MSHPAFLDRPFQVLTVPPLAGIQEVEQMVEKGRMTSEESKTKRNWR